MPGDVLRPWRQLLPRPTADRYQQRLRLSTEASAFKKLDTSREKAGQESIKPCCSWLNSRSSDSSLPCADCLLLGDAEQHQLFHRPASDISLVLQKPAGVVRPRRRQPHQRRATHANDAGNLG